MTTWTPGPPGHERWCAECGQKQRSHNDGRCPVPDLARTIARVGEHRSWLPYRGPNTPVCTNCRQPWPCDAVRLARAIEAVVNEPHHLGFPISGRTLTYDPDTVMVTRDWHDRLRAATKPERDCTCPTPTHDECAGWVAIGDPCGCALHMNQTK